jgi:competence transcription factor ComK
VKPLKHKEDKNNVTFINPKTMEVQCTLNDCLHKFDIRSFDIDTKHPSWSKVPITNRQFHHKCNECGRKYAFPKDKIESFKDYEANIANQRTYDELSQDKTLS